MQKFLEFFYHLKWAQLGPDRQRFKDPETFATFQAVRGPGKNPWRDQAMDGPQAFLGNCTLFLLVGTYTRITCLITYTYIYICIVYINFIKCIYYSTFDMKLVEYA